MYSSKEFSENLNTVTAIKDITSIYQEIASMKVKDLRESVAATRQFLEGVGVVYNHAKASYVATLQKQLIGGKKGDWKGASFIKRNGKKVYVLLSANEHLYGTLIFDVYEKFISELKKTSADALVVGSIGKYFIGNEKVKNEVSFFNLDDEKPEITEIKKIVNFLSPYEEIDVFYGKITSVLNQVPTREKISGGVTLTEKLSGVKNYLFEPSPEKIMEFFETEIIGALFNQAIFEHHVARYAARMVAMDQATENAKETIIKLNREAREGKRVTSNKKQISVFAGLSLWQEEEEQ